MRLTKRGKEKASRYIREMEAKRREILDAGKDTADETDLPDLEDILADISAFGDEEGYVNSWGVTDHYDADCPLGLERGKDYTE